MSETGQKWTEQQERLLRAAQDVVNNAEQIGRYPVYDLGGHVIDATGSGSFVDGDDLENLRAIVKEISNDVVKEIKALASTNTVERLACSNTVVGGSFGREGLYLKGDRVQHRKSSERGVLLGPAGPSAWIVEVDDTGAVRRWHRDHVDLVDLEQEGQEIAGDGERW